jgi:hypothetical protein
MLVDRLTPLLASCALTVQDTMLGQAVLRMFVVAYPVRMHFASTHSGFTPILGSAAGLSMQVQSGSLGFCAHHCVITLSHEILPWPYPAQDEPELAPVQQPTR